MKIAIVNNVPGAVDAIRGSLSKASHHQIVWTAADGIDALSMCAQSRPDLILMDLVLPRMDGIQATLAIMRQNPCAILVVTASINGSASRVIEALGAGAIDAVTTPMPSGPNAEQHSRTLLAKVDQVARMLSTEVSTSATVSDRKPAVSIEPPQPWLVAIGASAGGPPAVAAVLRHFEADCGASIVVVQHLDEAFAPEFAQWLATQCTLPVSLAEPGGTPRPNCIHVAGGSLDLMLSQYGRFTFSPRRADSHHSPSIDIFFESVAAHWRGPAAGLILTGMGRDGAAGLACLRRAGFATYAQDRASSAVFGMPKAAAESGAAQHILSLQSIGPCLRELVRRPSELSRKK